MMAGCKHCEDGLLFQEAHPRRVSGEKTDLSILKKDIRTERRMIHRLTILEGMVASKLLKAADVMKHPCEPGDISVLRRHIQRRRNRIAHLCNTVRMVILQLDLYIRHVIVCYISRKCFLYMLPIYFQNVPPLN